MSERPLDLIAIGRAAVDLYGEQIGGRLEDMTSFAKYLGGCPANVSVGAARLGLRVAMIARVGDEHMGRFVRETLAAEGVEVSRVKTDPRRLTALVILGIRDRDTFPLIFYRENCADMGLEPEDVEDDFIASATAVLVTGTHFSRPNVDAACRRAITLARAHGTRVVFDIDYRPVLWGLTGHGLGEERFVASDRVTRHLQTIVPDCDLVVGTEEEIRIAGGGADTLVALRGLRERTAAVLVVKRGALGCVIFPEAIPATIEDGLVGPGFPVEVFNILGAGDAFLAGFLRGWLRGEALPRCAELGNACGALVVSRHGCAPAMPSWEELGDYLTRGHALPRPREDERLEHLHRVTTRPRRWPEICALAFDHRKQLEEIGARHGRDGADIARFKSLIAAAAERVETGPAVAGALVDGRYGEAVLTHWTGSGRWLARPVERAGSIPVAFEDGPNVALTLRAWPAEQIVKCLVHYRADDEPGLRAAQDARLGELAEACIATGHELLVEVIPPPGRPADDSTVPRALAAIYAAGVRPDWWKLASPGTAAGWAALEETIAANDPHCRGVLLLGLGAAEAALKDAFALAAGRPLCKGFAVGRSIFAGPAEDWFAGRLDDAAATDAIAANYRRLVALWHGRARA